VYCLVSAIFRFDFAPSTETCWKGSDEGSSREKVDAVQVNVHSGRVIWLCRRSPRGIDVRRSGGTSCLAFPLPLT
jgi:hypothetical protein